MAADGDAGDSGAVGGASSVTINIRCSNGSKFSVQIVLNSTVGAFKAALAEKCDVPVDRQRLIYKGRILKDDLTLESYGLESDHTIHLVHGMVPQAPSADATATSNGSSRVPTNTTNVENSNSNVGGGFEGGDFGGLLFPGFGANGRGGTGLGLPGFGLPDLNQMQQQLAQNPSMMSEIMNTPAVQSLINNPELLRSMIMNNPQMREIIDRNPDFAHILNDPSILRQSLEVMRNPELMREAMRNTDRAMSNIESSPEGFNMLRRMYETVQEPFLNATARTGNMGNDSGQNPFAALLGNQGSTTEPGNQTPDQLGTASSVTTESAAPNSNPLPNPWNSTGAATVRDAQTTNSRPAAVGDGRSPGIAGLGGVGLPELERMAGRIPDPAVINQLLQNPAIMQMTQSLLSNPQFMNQVLNPQLRGLLGPNSQLNSQLSSMLQNPELIRQLTSPQQLLSLQPPLLQQQLSQEQRQTGGTTGTTGTNDNGMELLMNMFGLGSGIGAPNTPNVPPEERYAAQLSQLQEMGFVDAQENIRALTATAGNVHAAVDWLLRNLGR